MKPHISLLWAPKGRVPDVALRCPPLNKTVGRAALRAALSPARRLEQGILVCIIAWLSAVPALAQLSLPLPDHLVYGTVALSGQPVTAMDTNIAVAAIRPADGQLLASYQMGSASRLGEFLYELRIRVETAPTSSPQVAQIGETLLITVSDTTGVRDQATHLVDQAGNAERLDFGISIDANGNGVPDDWELAHFGSTTNNLAGDSDGDGMSDFAEYVQGTDPNNPSDVLRIWVQTAKDKVQVSFTALATAGPGYAGRQRFYALEKTHDLATAQWAEPDNLTRVLGSNQIVSYAESQGTNTPAFFRVRVWLEGP